MVNKAHANVSSNNIHECKGAAAASANTVRIADGLGSGSWGLVPPASISGVNNANLITLVYRFTDVSTPSSQWIVCPIAGIITKIYSVLHAAITIADTVFSFEIAGTPVTGGGLTIAYLASAAGDVDSSTPSAARALTIGQAIEIISDGGSTTVADATFTFVINVA